MNKLKEWFQLRGELKSSENSIIGIVGFFIILTIWSTLTMTGFISHAILPSPFEIVSSISELHFQDGLIINCLHSIKLNFLGYVEAILIAVPLGFIIGLFPVCKALFKKYVESIRFVPLTALTGLFIAWFGIDINMKIQFLAFGILVYLLPVVIQRIEEVENVYVQTLKTLGASKWQTIRYVFLPSVLSKLSDDIKNLVAISWTYIIVAEMINKNGGIGALIFTAARQSRLDKVFAILMVIVLIGFLQDKLFTWIDKILFKYKHV